MALLTAQQVTLAGVTPTYAAASAGGDTFTTTGKEMLHVKNTNAAARTVTIQDPNTTGPTAAKAFDADVDVVIPLTTGDKMIGPFPPSRFKDGADNLVHIDYSVDTGVTVALVKIT